MGNQQSHLSGLEMEEKALEVGDFWSLYLANGEHNTKLSVLIGDLFVEGPLWRAQTPLEKKCKYLMIYRHPCILKYISSWQKGAKFFLAVEPVKPLGKVLGAQNTLQLCIGLHSILKALCFLHEKASVSHNNLCIGSIYVSKDGDWKLGGMEYVCKYTELSRDFLKKSKSNRYKKSVDLNEEKYLEKTSRKDFIDIYAYGVLVCDVLKSKTDDDIPGLSTFVNLCQTDLQSEEIENRPTLKSLLHHEFFNHEFITILSFLVELPLKTDEEKSFFFENLIERLKNFPENIIADLFGNLLLSRMVLLNKTAQELFLPRVLSLREETDDSSGKLFTETTFRKYLVPKILEIFSVRDAQIRLLLLNYFPGFIYTFTKEELQNSILPELLVGVKDTNDHLVSVTLRALGDLVPILGATTVIGGKRAKLFNDGRPIVHSRGKSGRNSKKSETTVEPQISTMVLPERPSPDGEEGETSPEDTEQSVEEDLDNWEDWGASEAAQSNLIKTNSSESVVSVLEINSELEESTETQESLPDIAEIKIINQSSDELDQFDFFQDMEPVIEAASKFLIPTENTNEIVSSKLNPIMTEEANGDGWIDDDWD